MTELSITKPERLIADQETLRPDYGKFIASPLERGFGVTLGNSLRRILLSSIEGAAVYYLYVEGASHEYSAIEGVREDLVQIILNLKELRFILNGNRTEILRLKVQGSGEITAADIEQHSNVEIVNPDQYIATLDRCDSLNMEIHVQHGRGYSLAGEKPRGKVKSNESEKGVIIGGIPIDAKFSPVRKVNFKVENTRVGDITNYDRLILEVWTDATITAKEAVTQAARILVEQLELFIDFDENYVEPIEEVDEEKAERDRNLMRSVNEFELTVRSANCLEAANIRTVKDLVTKTEQDMLKYKNFGKKSLEEVLKFLGEMDLALGMELD